MNGTKPWWESKTIWGSIITVVAVTTGLFGIQIDPQTQAVLVDNVTALMSAGGAIMGAILGIYGRVKADKKVR